MLTGEVKAVLIKCLNELLADFQKKRSEVSDEVVKEFMRIKEIDR